MTNVNQAPLPRLSKAPLVRASLVKRRYIKYLALPFFTFTTSSPRWPQANGRSENAVRTAKRLMTKAAEAGSDPFLSLLDWRNTPSEQLGLSPTQLMFGRRTRSRLPTADALLMTPTARMAQAALAEAKRRQASYYDRGAKDRPTLPVGQTVRVRYDKGDWRKGEIARHLPHRSYVIKLEDGSIRRRTSRHVRFSSEPAIIIPDDDATTAATTAAPVTPTPPMILRNQSSPTQRASAGQETERQTNRQTTTRSGRVVRKPARYRE